MTIPLHARWLANRIASRMILTVGHTKGGAGKTTLAVQPAIARAISGRDVRWSMGTGKGPLRRRLPSGHMLTASPGWHVRTTSTG
jgi:hypothetical protein